MRFAFATCVCLGRRVIEKIYEMGGELEFLVTLNDEKARNKSGRVYLDDIAEKYDIPLIKINNINDEMVIEAVREHRIDWMFIIGWSQIARKELLQAPDKGCIGMHPTLLPKGRGRASIPWAIIKNLPRTGVTMFRLDEGVDTGDILGQVEIPLNKKITATELYSNVMNAHTALIEKYWNALLNDQLVLIPQKESEATDWPGRHPEDGRLSHNMTVEEAERLVRAVTRPYPGAFYEEMGRKVIVWSAKVSKEDDGKYSFQCTDGYLIPTEVEIGVSNEA